MIWVGMCSLGNFVGSVITYGLRNITDWARPANVFSAIISTAIAGSVFTFIYYLSNDPTAVALYPMGLAYGMLCINLKWLTEQDSDPDAGRIRVYTFDQNRLCLGDILLSRVPLKVYHKSTWKSFAIQKLTSSPFSHAALYVRFGLFIEAIGLGVCRFAIIATGARSKDNIRLLRLKDEAVELAREKARLAAQSGEAFLSRGYSVPGAAGVKLSILRDPERSGFFVPSSLREHMRK